MILSVWSSGMQRKLRTCSYFAYSLQRNPEFTAKWPVYATTSRIRSNGRWCPVPATSLRHATTNDWCSTAGYRNATTSYGHATANDGYATPNDGYATTDNGHATADDASGTYGSTDGSIWSSYYRLWRRDASEDIWRTVRGGQREAIGISTTLCC